MNMSGKGKMIAVVTTLCVGVGFTAVPLASAYPVPIPVGFPGGQPTKPQGGSTASKSLTSTAATALAGYTGAELAKLSPKVTLPSAVGTTARAAHGIAADSAAKTGSYSKVSCAVNAAKSETGSGSAKNGAKSFRINFTKSGKKYLRSHSGKAISLAVKCTFTPKKGKKSTSTSKVVLAA
jgi:hypothetical protein